MTSRIRDLTRTYDWYIYYGHINGKRTLQIESTTSRNGYNHKLCDLRSMSGYPRSLTSSDLMELNASVETQL